MTIKILPGYDRPKEVGTLFAEYTEMLLKGDPSFGKYLEIQNYEEELKHLEAKYGLPEGRLYLSFPEDRLAGRIGPRKSDAKSGEMKRLYVRPAYRGSRIGSRLVQKILADAEEIGYRCMLLDTLPFLQDAIRLYRKYGFYEIPRYNNNPMDSGIYMRLELQG